jgi:hypothetical protein
MPKTPLHDLLDGLAPCADLAAAAAEKEFVIDVQAVRELDAGPIEALVYREDILADNARDRYAVSSSPARS